MTLRATRRFGPGVEDLESRRLLASGLTLKLTQLPIDTAGAPIDVTSGPDGNLWFTDDRTNSIGEINAATHAITEFPIPTPVSEPAGIVAGADGNLHFTEKAADKIGQINPATHAITEVSIPTPGSEPSGIAAGSDGNLYFTESATGKIGEISPSPPKIAAAVVVPAGETITTPSGTIFSAGSTIQNGTNLSANTFIEFSLTAPMNNLEGIVADASGDLYVTENGSNKIGELSLAITAASPFPAYSFSEYPATLAGSEPTGIALGSDGNIYFTNGKGNSIGELNATTHAVSEFAISPPTPSENVEPTTIAAAPNGDLYFTETAADKIGVFTPGVGVTNQVAGLTPNSEPLGIAAGADGNVFFAESGSGQIGELNPQSDGINQFTIPPTSSAPAGIVVGSDRNLYFTESGSNKIGEAITSPEPAPATLLPYETITEPGGTVFVPGSSLPLPAVLTDGTVIQFTIPTASSVPEGIASGSDGNIYFTESATGKIGELTVATTASSPLPTDAFTEFPIPAPASAVAPAAISPLSITAGPPGSNSLYFTEAGSGEIGEINTATEPAPTNIPDDETITTPVGTTYSYYLQPSVGTMLPPGTITQFQIPTQNSAPVGIALGSDGNIYFTESGADKIGEILTAGTSVATKLTVPAGEVITTPFMWAPILSGSTISGGTFLPAGTIDEFNVPSYNGPGLIAAGPGGNVWFTLAAGGVLAYLNPTTGLVTDPAYAPQSFVIAGLTTGPAPTDDLYLTDDVHDQIGEVTSIGQPIITFGPATGSSAPLDQPLGITTDAHGSLWFTEYAENEIGEAQVMPAPQSLTALQTTSTLQLTSSATVYYTGESVTYIATVSGAAPTGIVTFFVDGVQQPPVALNPISPTESEGLLSLVVVNPGSQNVTAVYDGDFFNTTSSGILPPPSDGPTVLAVQRYGVHDQATSLVLTFSTQLDATAAMNPANYRLVSAIGLPIGISKASYNATSDTVTLRLKRKLSLHRVYELTVTGTGPAGLIGTSGLFLDGAGDGSPGSDYATSITGGDLVAPKTRETNPRQNRVKEAVSRVERTRT